MGDIKEKIRSKLHLVNDFPEELTFKVAETQEELEDAFKLLHEAYVDSRLMDPHPSEMRVTIFHALPSTTTLIAKWKNETVGTVSIVRDNIFGLPIDKIFDISSLRKNREKIAEISALAVRKDFRAKRDLILFPLQKFLYLYCHQYFGIDRMVIAVHPKWIPFYEGVWIFEPLKSDVKEYDYVKGALAAGAHLNLNESRDQLVSIYYNEEPSKNLFQFVWKEKTKNIHFPKRYPYFKTTDPVMTPELLNYFFNEKTSVFKELSEKEKAILHQLYYPFKDYEKVIPDTNVISLFHKKRKEYRYEISLEGIIESSEESTPITVTSVSLNGLGMKIDKKIPIGENYVVRLNLGNFRAVDLIVQCVHQNFYYYCGMKILEHTPEWINLIKYLENDLFVRNQSNKSAA